MNSLSTEIIRTLSSEYGDSFYLLDSERFRINYNMLLSSFRKVYDKTNIAYSYKTNYIPAVCQIVDKLGGFAEVVSVMEMKLASRLMVAPENTIWNGPVKKEEDIEPFIIRGGLVNIDSWQDFVKVCSIAERNGDKRIDIGVRCNFDIGDGKISRFGIDIDDKVFHEVLRKIADTKNIHLKSLQAHFAKRNYQFWDRRARGMLTLYDRVKREYGIEPEWLDLGGGISGPMPDELREQLGLNEFTYDDYSSRAAGAFSEHFATCDNKPWLLIEPGTALVADCMRYVCRVETIKTVRGKIFITVNGSQKNINMQNVNPPLEIISCSDVKEDCKNADIVGYTCIEDDCLFRNFNGSIGIGDYLVFGSCGSYSVVMKPPFILPNVPIVDISHGDITLVKRAEQFEDIFQTYNL